MRLALGMFKRYYFNNGILPKLQLVLDIKSGYNFWRFKYKTLLQKFLFLDKDNKSLHYTKGSWENQLTNKIQKLAEWNL